MIKVKELKTLGNGVAEKGRYALEFINVTKDYAEVTDGKMMIRHKIISTAIEVKLKDKKNVLIDPRVFTGREIAVGVEDSEMKILNEVGATTYNYPIEVAFPETNAILKEAKELPTILRIGLNKKLLLKVLKSIPDDGTYENEIIRLEFKAPDKAVYFKTGNTEGLILPVMLKDEEKK